MVTKIYKKKKQSNNISALFLFCIFIGLLVSPFIKTINIKNIVFLIIWIIFITIISFVIVWLWKIMSWSQKQNKTKDNYIYKDYKEIPLEVDEEMNAKYRYKWLMVENERIFYALLYNILHKEYWNRYTILCQVRMADLFEKVWTKKDLLYSLDFLIVDLKNDYEPVVAIELDWWSHKLKRQKENDKRKEKLISICPFNIIRIENEDNMDEELVYKVIIPELSPLRNQDNTTNIIAFIIDCLKYALNMIWLIPSKIFKWIKKWFCCIKWKYENKKLDKAYEETWIPKIDKEFIIREIKENNNIWDSNNENNNTKRNRLIFKWLLITVLLIIILAIISLVYKQIKNESNNNVIKENQRITNVINRDNKENRIITWDNKVITSLDNPCNEFMENEITSKETEKYKCSWDMFYSEYINACIKYEQCNYNNWEKRYFIQNLNEWEYIFSCHENNKNERKNYKITNPDIRDITRAWEKSCKTLYAEIFRELKTK